MANSEKAEIIEKATKLKETMKTPGWEVFHEHWELKIASILGGKTDNGWIKGKVSQSTIKEGLTDYYIGYKDALLDLYQDIHVFIAEADRQQEKNIKRAKKSMGI